MCRCNMEEKIFLRDIEIKIERKKIKNMHMYIRPPYGDVTITAPLCLPYSEIEKFVDLKESWILTNVEKIKNMKTTPETVYNDGDTVMIWGELYELHVIEGTRYSLIPTEDTLPDGRKIARLCVHAGCTDEQRVHFVTEWYRDELTLRVDHLLPKWESYTGLKCSSWQSKVMKTRWGTCNTKTKKIWLNVRLAEHPQECLEYVILHELAHTRVPNHGAEFKAILDEYMPDWKTVKRRLQNNECN